MMDLGDVLRLGQPADAEPPPNDIDATGRCCCGGCIGMGPCDLAQPDDYSCCALDEGHGGPCEWRCSDCGGTGLCPFCGGDGEDGSGLPDTCTECGGSGGCPAGCDEGMQVDDVYVIGRPMDVVELPEKDVT